MYPTKIIDRLNCMAFSRASERPLLKELESVALALKTSGFLPTSRSGLRGLQRLFA
ncbi:hypothetical protein BJX63DRAFT_392552 [Aspergillus granulosus]|uniref:Uncharacterized protein n=1 Tax=Aspergillus granulosus TaxID=176169 RepID=A0ABR4HFI5_9EURO